MFWIAVISLYTECRMRPLPPQKSNLGVRILDYILLTYLRIDVACRQNFSASYSSSFNWRSDNVWNEPGYDVALFFGKKNVTNIPKPRIFYLIHTVCTYRLYRLKVLTSTLFVLATKQKNLNQEKHKEEWFYTFWGSMTKAERLVDNPFLVAPRWPLIKVPLWLAVAMKIDLLLTLERPLPSVWFWLLLTVPLGEILVPHNRFFRDKRNLFENRTSICYSLSVDNLKFRLPNS